MKNRLFYKVFGTYIVIIVISMALVGFYAGNQIKTVMEEKIESQLKTCAHLTVLTSSILDIQKNIDRLAAASGARITLISNTGEVIGESERPAAEMDIHLNRPEVQEARVKGEGVAKRFSKTLGMDTLYVVVPVREGFETLGYLRFSRPLVEIKNVAKELNALIFQSSLIVGILSFFIAFLFAKRLVDPIKKMEEFTRRVRQKNLSGTLLVESGDELGSLGNNINEMVEELREKINIANEEKSKIEAAFSSMTNGILILDKEGRIEDFNYALEKIFNIRFQDVRGKTPLDIFRSVPLKNALEDFCKTGKTVFLETSFGTDKDPLVLDVTISSIHGLSEEKEKTMIVFHDVTRLKKLERMRVDFIANVTHEIKTPLTSILGYIETLQNGAIDEKETAKNFLNIIYRHTRRLNRLVDDLLTISNIELGETRLQFTDISVKRILKNVLPIITPKAAEKGLSVTEDIPQDLPALRADKDRLIQILLNILDNAVKFTPAPGKVYITAFDDDKGHIVIKINDTGIGIPKKEIFRLGERFYRVDKARSRELGGTGLGLSIVKHLMHAHNGSIEIESEPGKGTSVYLVFPVYPKDENNE